MVCPCNSAMLSLLEWIWNNGIFQTDTVINKKNNLAQSDHAIYIIWKNNTFLLCIGMSARSGTDADAASVREVFMNLRYKVKINNDLSCENIFKLLKKGKLLYVVCVHEVNCCFQIHLLPSHLFFLGSFRCFFTPSGDLLLRMTCTS